MEEKIKEKIKLWEKFKTEEGVPGVCAEVN